MSYFSDMASVRVMQGREVGESDVGMIRGLLDEHPDWCRSRLSVELCERWDWRNAQDRIKDMAARTLLLKLVHDRQGRPVACVLFGSACLCVPHADRRPLHENAKRYSYRHPGVVNWGMDRHKKSFAPHPGALLHNAAAGV